MQIFPNIITVRLHIY